MVFRLSLFYPFSIDDGHCPSALKWNHDKPQSDARRSVLKKWKDKTFSGGVNRTVIEKGAAMLGFPLDELIADTIQGMKPVAEKSD